MDQEDNFYTLKGYSLLEHVQITYSMEDYLEMICRLSQDALRSGSETSPNAFMSGLHPPQKWPETYAAAGL